MKRMSVRCVIVLALLLIAIPTPSRAAGPDDSAVIKDVLQTLNRIETVAGTDDTKCYKILFNAYLELSKPPFPVGPQFNLTTIHPKMSTWPQVSGWAESNAKMVDAILKCNSPKITMVGLPYGREGLDPAYVKAGLVADVGARGGLHNIEFPYLQAVDTIAAFATAEIYRLMEAGQVQKALDLAVAHTFMLRQFCDREFLVEKLHAIELLSDALSNMRDVFYVYQDKISADQFAHLALLEIPYLRPDRSRLQMPEADRIVAEYMIKDLFNEKTGQSDPDKFTAAFAEIQSKDAPMTRFGAAKRWRNIASIHDSRDNALKRLQLIYDDWWRRWRIDAYDSILDIPTQFARTNKIRYAAVIFSIQDVERLFAIRNQLIAEVNGTAMAAGICGYKRKFGTYPDQLEKTYTEFDRVRNDSDPYDKELRPFKYRVLIKKQSVDPPPPQSRLWIEAGEALLYSLGQDHTDSQAAKHTDDGAAGDIMLWPPIKAVSRAQGQLD